MVLCSTVVAFFLWNMGIQKIGASRTSMYMNLVPINATWISMLFYGSSITWQQIMGMALVIIAVFFSTGSPGLHFSKFRQHKNDPLKKTQWMIKK
ncbi:hypothetical protein GCM10007968_25810 [Sporolactobacillus putidus]|uniref:EamA domain-containing protein n=1 Tax=Sporolactobacillus putidus TaxID=492735 RepID=A0A917S602_9BACL|nr:hypothetical protein GCM10007968_25810 [Sporolactobacillus putidus]